MSELPKALVVDDVAANREFVERLLSGALFEIITASSGEAALEKIEKLEALPVGIIDMKLPDMTGVDLVIKLRAKYPDAYLVVASMYDQRSMIEQAFDAGCNVYLVKPHGFIEMFQRLSKQPLEDLRKQPHTVIDQYGPRPFRKVT